MLSITELKIEHMREGCVTDVPQPSVSFSLESDQKGAALKRAVVQIADWRCSTDRQFNIRYGGEPLKPYTRYQVYVKAEANNGETAEARSCFETGRLSTPWTGQFITNL